MMDSTAVLQIARDYARTLTACPATADDIAAEAVLRLLKSERRGRRFRSPWYVRRTVWRCLVNDRRARRPAAAGDVAGLVLTPDDEDPAQLAEDRDWSRAVHACASARDLQLAKSTGRTNAAKIRRHRARRRIARRLHYLTKLDLDTPRPLLP